MKKFFISVFFALFLLFSFTGCYDAVFQAIRTEVELSESTVTGFVNGIVRFSPEGSTKQFLFLANGVIQVKDATIDSSGYWYELSDEQMIKKKLLSLAIEGRYGELSQQYLYIKDALCLPPEQILECNKLNLE